ncbi:MAG: DUF4349 domain-containing protein [Pirellulales bacterium]
MRRTFGLLTLFVFLAGCNQSQREAARTKPQPGAAYRVQNEARELALQDAPESPAAEEAMLRAPEGGAGYGRAGGQTVGDPTGLGQASGDRKIIYNASLDLVVSDFSALETQLPDLVRGAQGYISEAQSDQQQGERTSGSWVVRIPSGDFDGFLQKVADLGVVEARRVTTEEVTEEYVDLEARIANKQKMEERVLEIIKQRSGPLAEVLQLEAELSRIREEIERMQGRLRLLSNQRALATVRISAREEHNYVPPQQPTLATQLRETWRGSWNALSGLGAAALLLAVAVAPWLLVVIPVGGLTALVWRRVLRNQALGRQGTG